MCDEIIELGNDVQSKAWDAYHSDNYFEAVQLMQLHLESSLRLLLFCCGPKRDLSNFSHATNVSEEISLSQGGKCLYIFGKISKEQYDSVSQFNRLRNKMVHQFNSSKLLKGSVSIKKSELESIFRRTNEISNEFVLQALKETET